MTETIRDFIALISKLILVLAIVSVIFAPNGIISSTFSYSNYAEPVTLLNHIATAMSMLGSVPGNAETFFRTSGLPYKINVYKNGKISYVSIDFSLVEQKSDTKFEELDPVPIMSNCVIEEQSLTLEEGIVQEIRVEKVETDTGCSIYIVAHDSSQEDSNEATGTCDAYCMTKGYSSGSCKASCLTSETEKSATGCASGKCCCQS